MRDLLADYWLCLGVGNETEQSTQLATLVITIASYTCIMHCVNISYSQHILQLTIT